MKTRFFCWFTLLLCATSSYGQGTLLYDQESSTDETSFTGGLNIQFYPSLGQSFSPSLSTVGFIRLRSFDINPGNGIGATLVVNLRSNSINGLILGTASVVLPDGYGYSGATNFLFASAIPVTPNATYFFETLVQAGDTWGVLATSDTYLKGSVFANGFPVSGNDLWFREGIIVPEPSVAVLLLGGGVFTWFIRKKQRGC